MKKILYLTLLALLLVLSGCNLPRSEKTPNVAVVEEIVRQTLTAESINQLQVETHPAETKQPEDEVILISPTPSNTLKAQTSPTATVTQTQPISDLKQSLGTPDWHDPLDNGNNFGIDAGGYQDDFTTIVMQDGGMVFTNTSNQGYHGWRLVYLTPKNFYFEAVFHVVTCSVSDQYGIVFRAPDYESGFGYYLGLTCDGKYLLKRWDQNGVQFVLDAKKANEINAGGDQTNIVGILAQGATLRIYINDVLLDEMEDTGFNDEGHFGIYVSGVDAGEIKFNVEQASLWDLQ